MIRTRRPFPRLVPVLLLAAAWAGCGNGEAEPPKSTDAAPKPDPSPPIVEPPVADWELVESLDSVGRPSISVSAFGNLLGADMRKGIRDIGVPEQGLVSLEELWNRLHENAITLLHG